MRHIFDFLDEYMKEVFEERSAILEFDANMTRDKAEQLAMEEIRRKVDSDKVNK